MGERVTFADLLKKAEEKKKSETKTKLEIVASSIDRAEPTPPTSRTPPTPPTKATPPTPPDKSANSSAAPERDFARVANSIVRDAVSQGLFIGKSKQIYDFLYSQTRGGILPTRNVRMTKLNLMRRSGIGSERTLLKNLNHLKLLRLIKITEFDGQHGGNDYEVFLPEETESNLTTPPHPPHPHYPPQKVGWVPPAESGVGGVGLIEENKGVTDSLRLSLKTNTNDDDNAFADFIEIFQASASELTGKKLTRRDSEKLRELSELLVLELKIAARRTNNISSVPAFLTEVLRRKLRDAPAVVKSPKAKLDTVGKPEADSYQIKALDKAGREAALTELREFAGDEFLQDFRKWYTESDWNWLMLELEKK